MVDKRKKRDLSKESKYNLFADILVLCLTLFPVAFFAEIISNVGGRNMLFMDVLYCVLMISLMSIFEKYATGLSEMWEQGVIIVLSSLIIWVLFCIINLMLFTSAKLFVLHTVMWLFSTIALIVENFLFKLFFKNSKRFRKARMLIIDSKGKNFDRMKRIKYGVLKDYDSWYEHIENKDEDYVKSFVDEKFPQFDAVCILDGLTDNEYNIAVKKALDLHMELFLVPKIIDIGKCGAQLVRFDDVLTLYMPDHSLNVVERFIKRTIDIVLSSIGLIVAAIPMLIISIAIKLTSPGPVFYKQKRLTRDKKEFDIYKFRTMIPDAEKYTGAVFAQKDDARITKIGKILRSCRLDELPQIINILKGDMSIVGPRPERPVFVEQFEKEVENYNYRFRVKAGLTALSHVYGRYSTYIHDRTCYDLYYISNYSLLLDLKIILLTAKTMFLKSAAEGEDEFKPKTTSNKESEVSNL